MGGFLWGFAGTSDDSTALYPTLGVATPQVYGSVAAPRAVRVYVPDGTDARDDVERGKRALRHKFKFWGVLKQWQRHQRRGAMCHERISAYLILTNLDHREISFYKCLGFCSG